MSKDGSGKTRTLCSSFTRADCWEETALWIYETIQPADRHCARYKLSYRIVSYSILYEVRWLPAVLLSCYETGHLSVDSVRPSAWNALPDFLKIVHFLYLLLDVSWNIFTSHSTSSLAHRARSRFFLQLTRYINYLLTYLLSKIGIYVKIFYASEVTALGRFADMTIIIFHA